MRTATAKTAAQSPLDTEKRKRGSKHRALTSTLRRSSPAQRISLALCAA
jgi:hypothetical protein